MHTLMLGIIKATFALTVKILNIYYTMPIIYLEYVIIIIN